MMDKCPNCGKKSIPKIQKYFTGPASITSCEECSSFVTISRDAYIVIAMFTCLFLPVFIITSEFINNKNLDIAIYVMFIGSFIYSYEKHVEWIKQN